MAAYDSATIGDGIMARTSRVSEPFQTPARPFGITVEQVLRDRAIDPLYQPIVDLATGAVVGAEALARGPVGSDLHLPGDLFPAAARAGLLAEIDQLCATRALELARDATVAPPLMFINAEPAALDRPLTPELLAVINSGLPFRIVLEFTERALTTQPGRLLQIADVTRSWGNHIALDDVGAEPASLAFMPLIATDVIKLDMSLLRAPDSPATVDTAALVTDFAHRHGVTVVAEGIETDADRAAAAALGAHWGQGWWFGRPGPLDAIATQQLARTVGLPAPAAAADPSPYPLTHIGTVDTVHNLWGALLRRAVRWHTPTTIFCAGPDRRILAAWAADLAGLDEGHIVLRGVVGALPDGATPGVRISRRDVITTDEAITAVAVTAHSAAVLRAVRRPHGPYDITFTDDPATGAYLGRAMLNHFG